MDGEGFVATELNNSEDQQPTNGDIRSVQQMSQAELVAAIREKGWVVDEEAPVDDYIRRHFPTHHIAIYCISALKEGLQVRHDDYEDGGAYEVKAVGFTAVMDGTTDFDVFKYYTVFDDAYDSYNFVYKDELFLIAHL